MAIHNCSECGLVHDHGSPVTNPEVEIARINAENSLKIAQLQARAEKHVAEVEAEADVEATELQADAVVDAAVAQAIVASELAEGEGEEEVASDDPVVVFQDNTDVAPEVEEPPDAEESGHEPEPRKKRGLGMWGS